MEIEEIVNDQFWLAYASTNINGAEADLKEAAGTLAKIIATFWGIYTTALGAGAISNKIQVESTVELIFFVIPVPLLMIGYVVTTWVQLPGLSTDELDPRIPEDVMEFYNRSVKEKKRQLRNSLRVVMAAAVSLTIALCIAVFTPAKNAPDNKKASLIIPADARKFK